MRNLLLPAKIHLKDFSFYSDHFCSRAPGLLVLFCFFISTVSGPPLPSFLIPVLAVLAFMGLTVISLLLTKKLGE